MTSGEGRNGARGRRWLLRIAAAAGIVALAVVAGRLLLARTSEGPGDRGRPKLHRWDLVGCYDLRVDSWRVEWRSDPTADAEAPSPGGREAGRGEAAGPRSSASGGGELPASFEPPAGLMLLPDSVDRWGRVLPSRRAEPLGGGGRRRRSLRWLVRRDTLWVVWSENDTRAGAALRRAGDSLSGRIRTIRGRDSLDATAVVSARRVNCWTRKPEPSARLRAIGRR